MRESNSEVNIKNLSNSTFTISINIFLSALIRYLLLFLIIYSIYYFFPPVRPKGCDFFCLSGLEQLLISFITYVILLIIIPYLYLIFSKRFIKTVSQEEYSSSNFFNLFFTMNLILDIVCFYTYTTLVTS